MNLLNTILIGLREVWAHKFRSLLTMLGIVLVVGIVTGMFAVRATLKAPLLAALRGE